MQGILGVVLAPGGRELVLGPLVGRAGSTGHWGLRRSLDTPSAGVWGCAPTHIALWPEASSTCAYRLLSESRSRGESGADEQGGAPRPLPASMLKKGLPNTAAARPQREPSRPRLSRRHFKASCCQTASCCPGPSACEISCAPLK